MNYEVYLIKSDEGYAVNCPSLPGCWSEGKTKEDALNNIKDAISLWLEAHEEMTRHEHSEVSKEIVTV
ncbi:type II toxin-antitoxin system HicB family antitoxin [Oscillatoria laete-virens NRMC-F 0139]|nr:type II toxin-antitoxin system HicB family antitoxin [Oscillatoria laete-virens]MDL5054189.1 type II toxin-antitoxin system HicB family antitoxin [Oscillatoria laete-virens NRMC-F 0139]